MQFPRKVLISIRSFPKTIRNSRIAKPYFAPCPSYFFYRLLSLMSLFHENLHLKFQDQFHLFLSCVSQMLDVWQMFFSSLVPFYSFNIEPHKLLEFVLRKKFKFIFTEMSLYFSFTSCFLMPLVYKFYRLPLK